MADKAALFKTAMKQLCARFDVMPTFMAKHNANLPGSSGHLHQSLWDEKNNLFFDATSKDKLSALAKHYVAGQLHHMPGLTAIYSPTINSYKRYVPGVWAPLTATWGIENRTCAIRVIPGDAKSTRIEYRQTAADMNPYLAMAAALAAGLDGIEKKMKLGPEAKGDASIDDKAAPLPRTLRDATSLLAKHRDAARLLGADFVDHWLRSRDWECRQYERAVTSWELERYFEII
jgi:glutamine synthetase